MSWIFSQALAANEAQKQMQMKQFALLNSYRRAYNSAEKRIAADAGLQVNEGLIPRDVWQQMDADTSLIMRAPNLTFVNDLLPRSKSVDPGKIANVYRIASDAGNPQTSLSGQMPIQNSKTAYEYDGNIIPVHTTGWEREWRELLGQRSEGFDGLIDDNANCSRALLDRMAEYMYTGDDSLGFEGYKAFGAKNHPNTKQIDLGAGGLNINLETATSGVDLYNAYKAMRDLLRIENRAAGQVTFYVSQTALSNLERPWDTANSSNINIDDRVRSLNGVADIKEDASLSGNEALIVIHEDQYIRPLTGMAAGTFAVPRHMQHANHQFYNMAIVGLEIRRDINGRSGVAYASA